MAMMMIMMKYDDNNIAVMVMATRTQFVESFHSHERPNSSADAILLPTHRRIIIIWQLSEEVALFLILSQWSEFPS